MSVNLELKSIEEILELEEPSIKFFIPSYQRGYRWDDRQVLDLLEDIYEFANKTRLIDEFYCLQPIVVRFDEQEKYYKVIDGQQRLTTIYIILKYLQESSESFKNIKQNLQNNDQVKKIFEFCDMEDFEVKDPFTIMYETRKNNEKNNSLNSELFKETNYDNPDFYYISKAYQTIKTWFKIKRKKLFYDTLIKDTKVIWYLVNCKDDKEEIEIFTRLNIGKIQLTNAELIKAMLLLEIKEYEKQIEFSAVWDNIEQTLQKNDFWYFLSNSFKSETAIDLIFEILAQKYQEEYNKNKEDNEKLNFKYTDEKYAYYIFAFVLKQSLKTEDQIWQDTQKLYRTLLNWNNDREMYHKIGYLIHFNNTLLKLYQKYENKTKDEFKSSLNNLIKKDIETINLYTLIFKNKEKVHKVLLLFNIETILQNKNSNARFDFFHFKFIEQENEEVKKRSWDIEHIASQTDNVNKEEWVESVLKYVYGMDTDKYKEKIAKIAKDKFDTFYNRTKRVLKIKELSEDKKDNIGNLTLLDSKTNRSYGNAFFPVKRAIIIDEDSSGNFIPICTKNIFLKQYSKKLANMMNWTDEDIENYRDDLFLVLLKYNINFYCNLKGENNE